MSKKSKTPRRPPATESAAPPRRRKPPVLLHKGVLIALIGLAVLISPHFIQSPALQQAVAGSSLVGWFSLVLGLAFIAQYLWQRRRESRQP